MKRNLYSLIIVLFTFAGTLQAQPGYQGRKWSVQGNLMFLPALTNASYGREPGLTTFNITGEATVDYVLSRRTSVGLSYRRIRTSNINDYGVSGVSKTKVFSNAYGIHYRIYKRKNGNIAPLGKYFQWGAGAMFNQVKKPEKSSKPVDFKTYSFRMGAGRNRILYDRLILSYGWEFGYMFTGLKGDGLVGATYYYKDDAQTMAQYRLWRHSLLNLKVGLGFLAY